MSAVLLLLPVLMVCLLCSLVVVSFSRAPTLSFSLSLNRIQLEPDDEFFLLGCDGIWDCLTNEKAVAYVRSRLDTCLSLQEIITELLDEIVSIDPRVTQGIGGDNMTLMIVDLQPQKRMYSHYYLNDDDDADFDEPILNVD